MTSLLTLLVLAAMIGACVLLIERANARQGRRAGHGPAAPSARKRHGHGADRPEGRAS